MNKIENEVYNKLHSGEYFISLKNHRFEIKEYPSGKIIKENITFGDNRELFECLDIGEYIDDGRNFVLDKDKVKRFRCWCYE